MSKQFDAIRTALQSYRDLLGGSLHCQKALNLIKLSYEIEQVALQLEEGVKNIDGLKIPASYSDTLAISDLISLIESLQPGTAIHPATKLPLEQTPSFLIAKKWLNQGGQK
ncbi:hypothetical protein [Rheinheimera aquimaris]|uniref:hypothetical protein n=1 Tax=Rheinheimera aquimaris TaxID=412437 RepID=UPI003A984F31